MPPRKKKASRTQSQKYDASFKNWILQQAPVILPLLVPGVEYEQAVNVEVIPSAMRVDKAFQVRYCGERLTELAQKKVLFCKKSDALEQLCLLLQDVPDMRTAQQLLESMSEQ
jgi:hypothetical protein